MACLTPAGLRSLMRDTLLAAGGRGFVRFARAGEGLLVTDALRRVADEAERRKITDALEAAGFVLLPEADGLLSVLLGDALLAQLGGEAVCAAIDWTSPLHPMVSLGMRLAAREIMPLTEDGRRLVFLALRILWQEDAQVLSGLSELRALAAAMQRKHDVSGFALCGQLLLRRAFGER